MRQEEVKTEIKAELGMISLLEVSAAQAQAILSEIELASKEITSSFMGFAHLVENAPATGLGNKSESAIPAYGKHEGKKIKDAAIVQLQTFDRTMQRLSHLRDSLLLMADESDSGIDGAELFSQVRGYCSMPHESDLFELAVQGASREEIFKLSQSPEDSIDITLVDDELF